MTPRANQNRRTGLSWAHQGPPQVFSVMSGVTEVVGWAIRALRPRTLWWLLSLLVLLDCKPPETNATIRVVPGASERAFSLESKNRERALASAKPASIKIMETGDELGGPNAVGKPGDYLLENDEIAIVIDGKHGGLGFAESGGNIVDVADAKVRKDELGQVFTYFGSFPRQGVYDEFSHGTSPDGSAWVEVKGKELYEPSLSVRTTYVLRKLDRALTIDTVLENQSDKEIRLPAIGDVVQWGALEKTAPGYPPNFRGPFSGPYVGGVGRYSSVALSTSEGLIAGISGGGWSDTEQVKDVSLGPKKRVSYTRLLVVGPRADTSGVVAELVAMAGQPLGRVQIRLENDFGQAIDAPADARLELEQVDTKGRISVSASEARLETLVPPGKYKAFYLSGGGRVARAGSELLDVVASGESIGAIKVSSPGEVSFECTEVKLPVPCKMTLLGVRGTKTPDLGPAFAIPGKNQLYLLNGACQLPLAPGFYEAYASRGPEYNLEKVAFEVLAGKRTTVAASLSRVVDTTGYLAADFHQHTTLGADASTSVRDRVIANAAEGVEIAVASEHNVVADLQPLVRSLKLDSYLVEVPGNEVTSDSSKEPWGHANVFPLAPTQATRGGAFPIRNVPFSEIHRQVRALPHSHVFQINHPRAGGVVSFFDQMKFDPHKGVGAHPEYNADFDALEVWNGRDVEHRDQVLQDYFSLLQHGFVVTPTADTDTHGIVGQEAGYPRTYVRVENESDLSSWNNSRNDDFVAGVKKRRDVVLTNGPFLRVLDAKGTSVIGRLVRAPKPAVTLKVLVATANWNMIDQLEAVVLSSKGQQVQKKAVEAKVQANGSYAAEIEFALTVAEDSVIHFRGTGSRTLEPVLAEPENPYVLSGPIFVDRNGDLRSFGKTDFEKNK